MKPSERILRDLKLSEKRMRHTLGVERAAAALAARHYPFLDPETVSAAALMHDFTKEYPHERQLELCREYGIPPDEGERANPKLLHAKTAAAIAEKVYNLPGEAVSAIRWHTVGRPDMQPLEQVIYFADYIEEFRSDPGCVAVRDYYHRRLSLCDERTALLQGLLFSFDTTLRYLLDEGRVIYSVDARNWLVKCLADAGNANK